MLEPLSGRVVEMLRRCFVDRAFAASRSRLASLWFGSRTLREHYGLFVWDFGEQPLL